MSLNEADILCRELDKDTLDRLTKEGFDRRLIKPLIDAALIKNGIITGESINELMDDSNFMIALGKKNGILG